MKKIIILFIIFILTLSLTYADGLSNYPDYFVDDNELNVIVVVGDSAPATHVLAQTQIILSLSQLSDKKQLGLAKLASEIGDINDYNIISIGNSCDNEVSAEILNNPQPCNKNIEAGKATIEYYENGKVHIVLNAYSNKGIKKSAEVLSNYKNYDLDEIVYEIEVQGEVQEMEEKIREETEEEIKEEKKSEAVPEQFNDLDEIEEEENTKEEQEEEVAENKQTENNVPEPILKEDTNILKSFFSWIFSLFGR